MVNLPAAICVALLTLSPQPNVKTRAPVRVARNEVVLANLDTQGVSQAGQFEAAPALNNTLVYVPKMSETERDAAGIIASEYFREHPDNSRKIAERFEFLQKTEDYNQGMESARGTPPDLSPSEAYHGTRTKHYSSRVDQLSPALTRIKERQKLRVDGHDQTVDDLLKIGSVAAKGAKAGGSTMPIGPAIDAFGTLYPMARQGINRLSDDPMPNDVGRVIAGFKYGLEASRSDTPLGRVLRADFEAEGFDLDRPFSEHPAVKRAISDQVGKDNTKRIDEVKSSVRRLAEDVRKVSATMAQGESKAAKSRTSAERLDQSIERHFNGTQEQRIHEDALKRQAEVVDAFQTQAAVATNVGYTLRLFKEEKLAQQAFKVANGYGQAARLLEFGSPFSSLSVATGWYGLITSVILDGGGKQDPSLIPELIEEIKQLRLAIFELGKRLSEQMNQMDERLGNLLDNVLRSEKAIELEVTSTSESVVRLNQDLTNLGNEIISQQTALMDIVFREQDTECLGRDGDSKPLAPKPDMFTCRDRYASRAAETSRAIASNSERGYERLKAEDLRRPFALSTISDAFAQKNNFPLLHPGEHLPDERTWAESVDFFVALFMRNPGRISDIDMIKTGSRVESESLDKMIRTGEQYLAFKRWASLWKDGHVDKVALARISTALDDIFKKLQRTVDEVEKRVRTSSVIADVRESANGPFQTPPPNAKYAFLMNGKVELDKTFEVKFENVQGTMPYLNEHWRHLEKYQRSPDIIARVKQGFKALPFSSFVVPEVLLERIAHPILWLELLNPTEFHVQPVLRQFQISNLDMRHDFKMNTEVVYDIYVVDLKAGTRTRAQTIKFEKALDFSVTNAGSLWSDGTFNASNFMQMVWPMATEWGIGFKAVEDADSEKVISAIYRRVQATLNEAKKHIIEVSDSGGREREINRLKREIALSMTIGGFELDPDALNILKMLIDEGDGIPNVDTLVRSILEGSADFSHHREYLVNLRKQIQTKLMNLTTPTAPPLGSDQVEERLEVLRRLRTERAKLLRH